jgi:hypothetical protein
MHDVLVKLAIDVLDVLQSGRIDGALFGFDSAIVRGSRDLGTDRLATVVDPGDTVSWFVSSLECEAYVNIVHLELPAWMRLEHVRVADRDFWRGHVIGDPAPATYDVTFEIGRYGRVLRHAGHLRLLPRSDGDLPLSASAGAPDTVGRRPSTSEGGR